jgi:hypothetical protein
MAVFTILSIGVVAAIGTFVEAKLGLQHAQRLVYRSPWMMIVMGVFILNLVAVIVDRWPWQRKHMSFIFAHVGIILIILGQSLTNHYGLDGSMRIAIGSQASQVVTNETEVQIYSSFDAQNYTRLYHQDVDFIKDPPTSKKPLSFNLENSDFQFVEYAPFVIPRREIEPAEDSKEGSAVRVQLTNPNIRQAQMIEWLYQRSPHNADELELGPLTMSLGPMKSMTAGAPPSDRNQLNFQFENGKLKVEAFDKNNPKPIKSWTLNEGDSVPLTWMGFQLKVLRVLPAAREVYNLTHRDGPTDLTTPAVRIHYKNQDHWILLNDTVKLFSENAVYIIAFSQKRVDLKFPITLNDFEMQTYKGTNRAMEYKSIVSVPDVDHHVISMNEPLKYKGLTFYQASFQNDQMGRPVASILSVNYDPGRFMKYFGSLMMTLGIVLLFYFKRSYSWFSKKD